MSEGSRFFFVQDEYFTEETTERHEFRQRRGCLQRQSTRAQKRLREWMRKSGVVTRPL